MAEDTKVATQAEVAREDQVLNNMGGAVFTLDKWSKLDRFLILGSDKSSYVGGYQPAVYSFEGIKECIEEDGVRTVDRIVEISQDGRAMRNDPAIFALAYCLKKGDLTTRRTAGAVISKVCRTGTHLFQLANAINQFGGWGRIVHRALQNWYNNKDPKNLGYQLMKYQSREGWSHGDILGKARPTPPTEEHNHLYRWAVKGEMDESAEGESLDRIRGFEEAKALSKDDKDKVISLVHKHDLPRECVPTWLRSDPEVQMGLLNKMPMNAMIRNLGGMTASGMLSKYPKAAEMICERLVDENRLKKARVHPMAILQAMKIYQTGHGVRGKLQWSPVDRVVEALDKSFYAAFQSIEPTGKRICLALDVSGSMQSAAANLHMSCREASAAMALVTAATEPNTEIVGFTCAGRGRAYHGQTNNAWLWEDSRFGISGLKIDPTQRLDKVVESVSRFPHGGTDCAAPIVWAYTEDKKFDLFVVYTDNETWAGNIHPYEAIREYRKKTGIPARLVVVAIQNRPFSIADPRDSGMLDVVGCDSATPKLISDFSVGRI